MVRLSGTALEIKALRSASSMFSIFLGITPVFRSGTPHRRSPNRRQQPSSFRAARTNHPCRPSACNVGSESLTKLNPHARQHKEPTWLLVTCVLRQDKGPAAAFDTLCLPDKSKRGPGPFGV